MFLPTNGVMQQLPSSAPQFTCSKCIKGFKHEKRRDIHEERCDNPSINNRIDSESIHNLFKLILELKEEVKELKQEVKSLHNGPKRNRPLEILEYLNEGNQGMQPISLYDYLNEVVVCTSIDLQTLFKTSFVNTVTDILHRYMIDQESNKTSIKAYNQKDGILYHFNGKQWKVINNPEWECIVGIVECKLAKVFSEWSDENITDLENNRQQDDWLEKVKKFHDTSPNRFSSIKKKIYSYIKIDMRLCV